MCKQSIFTPPRNHGRVIFSLQFVCVSVCLCVRLCLWSWTDESIWTRFSLNGCLLHCLEPNWNWWSLDICPYLKFYWTYFVLRTNTIQQHNVHLMINMKVTSTDNKGHRRRSNVTKNELMVISRKLLRKRSKQDASANMKMKRKWIMKIALY